MRQLSATEAIGPAWDHTKATIARPFKFGRAFKVCLVACLAQIVGAGISLHRQTSASLPPNLDARTAHFFQMITGASIVLWAIFFLIGIVLYYVGCRMQFVLFDFIVTRNTTVAPAWQRHGHHTFRWIAVRLIPTAYVLLLTAFSAYFLSRHLNNSSHAHGVVVLILGAFGLFVFITYAIITSLMRDFILPVIALEDLSIADCLSRFSFFLSTFTADVCVYLIIRILLAIAIWIATFITFIISVVIICIPVFILAAAIGAAGHSSTGALAVVGIISVLGFFVAGIMGLIIGILASGTVQTFFTAMGIYFYGSRYPLLGNMLEPPPPPPAYIPPPEPPPAPFEPEPTPI